MIKITTIKEAKNIEIYNDFCVRSVEDADEFLLKFEISTNYEYGIENFYFILDELIDNNFNFSVYKDYDKSHKLTLAIEGNQDNRFGIVGLEIKRGE